MLELLLNLLRSAAVVSALLLVAAANVKRPKRVEQTWMPVVACTYSVVALIAIYTIPNRIQRTLNSFAESIVSTLDSVGLRIPFLDGLVSMLDRAVEAMFSSVFSYVTLNIGLLVVFAALKRLLRPVFARLFKDGRSIAQFAAADVYSFDPELEMWFVEPRYGKVRDLYRALYWTSVCLCTALITLALTYPDWPVFSTVAYPAIAAMILGEFFFAVDGLTREEFSHDLSGERDASRRVGNFGPLREILRKTFPEEVLEEGVHLSSLASLDSGQRIGDMSRSGNPSTRLAGAYFDRLREGRFDLDVNYVEASAALLEGKNVLFANPFPKDLTPYLCLPSFRELLERRRVLVISGRNATANDLVQWMDRGLQDITGVPGLWTVGMLNEVTMEERQVGILRFADLHNRELLVNNDHFFSEVGLIIMAEPSLMLSTGQVGLELVLERCSRRSQAPVVAAFDANHDGLVDTMSHLTKSEFTEVVASALPQGACSEVVWRADGAHMQTSILPGVARYLGVGTEISAVALKYDVSRVHWVGADAFPVVDMRWIAQQYYAPINQFADLEMSQDALGERIVAVANPWDLPQGENYFLVVEDLLRNVYETERHYATRAKRSGFVNLISDDYLLRDYMIDNRDVFTVDSKAIPSLVPDYTRTDRNVILRVMLTLRCFGMTESDIARELGILGWDVASQNGQATGRGQLDWEPESIRRLRAGIEEYTGVSDVPLRAKTDRGFLDDAATTYFLQAAPGIDEIMKALGPAYFFVEDEIDGANAIGGLLLDHVHQQLLPGQFVTHGGKFYEVQSITLDQSQGRVILRRAADHIRDRRVYRQLRHYEVNHLRLTPNVGAKRVVQRVSVTRAIADVTAKSMGYVESATRSSLDRASVTLVDGVPVRQYRNKSILVIQLEGVPGDIRQTLAVLLNELFVTLFPHAFAYICALTPESREGIGQLMPSVDIGPDCDGSLGDARSCIFILEDSLMDLGLTSAVERNWERVFEIITDYLEWVQTPEPTIAEPVRRPVTSLFPERPEYVRSEAKKSVLRRLIDWTKARLGRQRENGLREEKPKLSSPASAVDEAVVTTPGEVAPDDPLQARDEPSAHDDAPSGVGDVESQATSSEAVEQVSKDATDADQPHYDVEGDRGIDGTG